MQANRRNTVTLVLGGVRSGKSHYAQQLGERPAASSLWPRRRLPTTRCGAKIDRHRSSRPQHWQTVEEPLALGRGDRPVTVPTAT